MNLDSPEELREIDSLSMFEAAESLPSQMTDCVASAPSVVSQVQRTHFNNLICCGMGGSAMGVELVRSWLRGELTAPIVLIRDYLLPSYVSDNDLVFLASYSGDTEETLSCMVEAAKKRSTMVSVSSGGKLEEFSKVLKIPHVKIPGGYQPRTALGFLFTVPLMLLVHLEVVPRKALDDLLDSNETLRAVAQKCSYRTPTSENPAKQLALKLLGSLPIIYGHGAYAAAAQRFKQQLNENCKMFAKYEPFPELNHNDIEGFDAALTHLRPILILLRGDEDNPQMKNRIDQTLSILRDRVVDIVEVRGIGSGITQLLTTIQICDSASLFLACLRGIDPGPVNRIDKMKEILSKKTNLVESLEAEVKRLAGHESL